MTVLIIIFSLLIGSFLNVCIYRIPRNKSIVFPASHCPKCGQGLKPVDLIPVISYFLNKGRCRYCGDSISLQYPIVELLNMATYLILYYKFGISIEFLKYGILTSLLIVIAFIDYEHKIIPDRLIILGLLTAFASITLYNTEVNIINGTVGLLIGGGILLIIAVVTNGAMGGGDIKLMGVLGLMLGWKKILLVLLLSFILGSIISIFLLVLKIKGRKDYIAFGPFISIAAFIAIIYGNEIINWYIALIINS
jgi:leader peptidase (prepilin peptidase)/N-methyltransferase